MNDILAPFKNSNRSDVDLIGDLRAVIKEAKSMEEELKERILESFGSSDSVGGADYIAYQSIHGRKGSFDEKKLKEKLGNDLESYRKPSTSSIKLDVKPRELPDDEV